MFLKTVSLTTREDLLALAVRSQLSSLWLACSLR